MKKLLTAAALLVAVAAPAFAQPEFNAKTHPWKQVHQGRVDIGVYDEKGALIGADPDPNVRMEIRNDHNRY